MSTPLDLSFGSNDLITGEAVTLELPAANIGVRILSGLIDLIAMILTLVALIWLGSVITSGSDAALRQIAGILAFLGAALVLPTTLETLTHGHSLGKLALGLRTVRDDAGPIQFRQALVRALIGMVEILTFAGVPAVFSALLSSKAKRLGDHAAGTYVVRERVSVKLPPRPLMPPQLAGWAVGADIATLPGPLALAIRQFLARANTLTPQARYTLGQQLCAEAMTHVSPRPPAGGHVEDVLAAILADRSRRDAERLQRDSALRQRLLPEDTLTDSRQLRG